MGLKEKRKHKEYQDYVKSKTPTASLIKNCIMAFIVGGIICTVGQIVTNIGVSYYKMDKETVASFTPIVMVFLGAFLTGLGVYDDIGKYGGAGSVVPITGFANSIVSPAMEYKREGYVFGVGAKLFSLAGPVLVYGITSSVITGLIYYFFVK